ncbi:Obscurin-like protein [Daphnia magna]|uniref:Obscurin-like protein n=1 Tax=Daphnia magna TaxID=35525 RepID=A0A164PKW2_9CRUS|nr:Obscurin-like protein [Daphnia magna]
MMGPEPPVSLSTCSPATNSDSVRLFSVAYQTRSGKVCSEEWIDRERPSRRSRSTTLHRSRAPSPSLQFRRPAMLASCIVIGQVSWMKKTEDDLQLLTVGESSHTADPRISPDFTYPHLWQLKFNPAMINDSGTYLCHISTDPPLIRHIRLEISVPEPIVEIVDSLTDAALSSDRVLYYRIGSSLELRCRVKRYWIKPTRFHWLKSGNPVSDELWRGGISIYTEITKPGQLENKLSIANATINDGGNYTCSLDSFSVSIVVHFLKEEKQAASQHASNGGHSSVMENAFHQGMACHLILSFLLQVGISHRH